MTGPKEDQAKTLHPLGQTQPFERERRAMFTMEDQCVPNPDKVFLLSCHALHVWYSHCIGMEL